MAESVVKDRFTKNKQTQGFKCVTRLDVKQTRIENKREITESVVIFFILFFFYVFVCLFCFLKPANVISLTALDELWEYSNCLSLFLCPKHFKMNE